MRKGASRYGVFVERAWTKEGLAVKVAERLGKYPEAAIFDLTMGIDFGMPWPFRRNWALVTIDGEKVPDDA